jgi:hypothetical protein
MTFAISGHIRLFSLLAARLVGKEQHVVAFETNPEMAARL